MVQYQLFSQLSLLKGFCACVMDLVAQKPRRFTVSVRLHLWNLKNNKVNVPSLAVFEIIS